MGLLLDVDYEYLSESNLEVEESLLQRFLIIKKYPIDPMLYHHNGNPIAEIEILLRIPLNYNTSGGDMFWTFPKLERISGTPIPNYGADPKIYNGKTYDRWSRHWNPNSWTPKTDTLSTILNRVEWALRNPSANR